MNKGVCILIAVALIFFAGLMWLGKYKLDWISAHHEIYNQNDEIDFEGRATKKFEIIQFMHVYNEQILKSKELNGTWFLVYGHVTSTENEQTIVKDYYFCYVENQRGGGYFAKIPANKVRFYQDSEKNCAFIIGAIGEKYEKEFDWETYEYFNIHVPKGTVIKTMKNVSVDNYFESK
jgi:hypothetical protein